LFGFSDGKISMAPAEVGSRAPREGSTVSSQMRLQEAYLMHLIPQVWPQVSSAAVFQSQISIAFTCPIA
jgi:hypothetical protein